MALSWEGRSVAESRAASVNNDIMYLLSVLSHGDDDMFGTAMHLLGCWH